MKNSMEDILLDKELQELYSISKNWVIDLDFFSIEINFMKEVINELGEELKLSEKYRKILDLILSIKEIDDKAIELKRDITGYQQLLATFINNSRQRYELNLIETHVFLEHQISLLLQSFNPVKKSYFDLISGGINFIRA